MTQPDELDTRPIIARLSAATPGPWQWYGSTDSGSVALCTTHSGRIYVLAFDRLGRNGAGPRFSGWRGRLRDMLRRHARYEVLDHRTRAEAGLDESADRSNSPLYREDFVGIDHPDADFIAHAPEDVAALLLEVRRLGAIVEECCQLLHLVAETPPAMRRLAARDAVVRLSTGDYAPRSLVSAWLE